MKKPKIPFPDTGADKDQLLTYLKKYRQKDIKWKKGKSFCLVYYPGDERAKLIKSIFDEFYSENALNPSATPSLTRMEGEIVSMCADLFNGDANTRGNITSGGTESIVLAVKTARDWAKTNKPEIKSPEIIIPSSAHPAFIKASNYLGLNFVVVPVKNFRANPEATAEAITENTILLVGSAPSYPHGLIDPISEIAELAHRHNILCHVDSCIGGFMLPFVKQLGFPTIDFDFNVKGVTSISADMHKYGYAPKGASIVLYKNPELRKFQFSVYTNWSGGVYGSPTILGTRPGGSIAGAWAALKGIGKEGYMQMANETMLATKQLINGINEIDELEIIGHPEMSIVSFQSSTINVYQLADELNKRGWHFERQHLPASLHFSVNYIHRNIMDTFVAELKEAVKEVKKFKLTKLSDKLQIGLVKTAKNILPEGSISKFQQSKSASSDIHKTKTAPMYGMMNVLAGSGELDDIVLDFLEKINTLE